MKRLLLVTGLVFGLWYGGWAEEVTLTYLGHSGFTLQAGGGPILMIDPYGTPFRYPALPKAADVVHITHGHMTTAPGVTGRRTGYWRIRSWCGRSMSKGG